MYFWSFQSKYLGFRWVWVFWVSLFGSKIAKNDLKPDPKTKPLIHCASGGAIVAVRTRRHCPITALILNGEPYTSNIEKLHAEAGLLLGKI